VSIPIIENVQVQKNTTLPLFWLPVHFCHHWRNC